MPRRVLVLAALLTVGLAGACADTTETELQYGAQEVCHQQVKKLLKSPGTADFESFREATVTSVGKEYSVTGHVDSQNTFGGVVRSTYTCRAVHEGGDQWNVKVDSLTE